MICRDGMVGAAGRAASTKPHQPPLETIPIVVKLYHYIYTGVVLNALILDLKSFFQAAAPISVDLKSKFWRNNLDK